MVGTADYDFKKLYTAGATPQTQEPEPVCAMQLSCSRIIKTAMKYKDYYETLGVLALSERK